MSISEVLLFIATNSKACVPCLEFVERYKFPARVVRLDSDEARNAAASGTYFQITVVPTMIVIYEDGNTQLFLGAPKITQWLKMLISRQNTSREREEQERGVTSYLPAGGNMYGPRPNPPRFRHPPDDLGDDPRRNSSEEHFMEEPEEDESKGSRVQSKSRIFVEEDEPEEEPEEETRKSSTKSKKKAPQEKASKPRQNKSKKKKKPPVNFEESVEVEYIEEAPQPQPQKSKKAPSRMTGIYAAAKQMEQDRKSSLGYKEEDLPRYQ